MTFGILVNLDKFELCLPTDKLARLQDTLQQWVTRRSCIRRDLYSLLGHLHVSHAETIIPQGQVFRRQLFLLLFLVQAPHHFIHMDAGASADLIW